MIKLVVFDLDKTLAELGKGVTPENIKQLKQLEEKGVRIAICSGKTVYYLCGFMRQLELEHPILIGENGAVIQFGVDLPPKNYYKFLSGDSEVKAVMRKIEADIKEKYPDIWFQPNEVMLSPFPQNEEQFDWIQNYIDKNDFEGIDVYRHCDCFDILPKGISKGSGLEYLTAALEITPEEMVAVGDGVNDYSMFSYAGTSIGIHLEEANRVDYNFDNISEVLNMLNEKCEGQALDIWN